MRPTWQRHFLGLPLHPMLVHIPLVAWLSLPVFDLLALLRELQPWWNVALTVAAVGACIGLIAVITGVLDYLYLSDTGSNDVRLAARHGVRTTLVWMVMTAKLAAMSLLPPGQSLVIGCLVVDALACLLLLQAAWFGTAITYGGSAR